MEIVLTGSRGAIGRCFKDFFSQHENDKTHELLFDLSIQENFQKVHFEREFIVIHFAGAIENDIDKNIRNNVIATSNIARMCQHPKCHGLIFISSIAVYGEAQSVITKMTRPNPISMYGKSKLICENIIKTYFTNKSFIILRPTNVFANIPSSICGKLVKALELGDIFEAWTSSLTTKRDYILLEDLIEVICCCIRKIEQCKSTIKKEYIIASGFSYDLEEIIKIVESRNGERLRINVIQKSLEHANHLFASNEDTCKILQRYPRPLV